MLDEDAIAKWIQAEILQGSKSGEKFEGPTTLTVWALGQILVRRDNAGRIADPSLWGWDNEEQQAKGWFKMTSEWRDILGKQDPGMEQLNKTWNVEWRPEHWKDFWASRKEEMQERLRSHSRQCNADDPNEEDEREFDNEESSSDEERSMINNRNEERDQENGIEELEDEMECLGFV
ncbi:hypothetical protein R1flu_027478 [Riccia fluitans]|uniref:Uncharacterized protein n=1 Tax=Riccia fluitans TaxID=41844 RepID=A0ABD1XJF4_9MARC